MASRIKQIAQASSIASGVSLEKILAGISIWRPADQPSLIEMIKTLPDTIQANPACKLVVIDSIAFFFRSYTGDYAERTRKLAWIAQTLRRTAQMHQIAVRLIADSRLL